MCVCVCVRRRYALTWLWSTLFASKRASDLRVAAAGRSRSGVEASVAKACKHFKPVVVLADVADERSVYLMVARTRVVINCVGPYMQFGEPVVKACASLGVDYVDITGEQYWGEAMRVKYHDVALRSGARIIPFCGHDSVPADLTAWFTLSQISAEELLQSHAALIVCAKVTGRGVSNGTFKTLLELVTAPEQAKLEPEGKFDGQARIAAGVQLVDDVPASHGGPLAVLPTEMASDAYVVRLQHARKPEYKAGRLEIVNALVMPNRPAAYAVQGALAAAPYVVRVLAPVLRRLSSSGMGPSQPTAGPQTPYAMFGVLRLYPLKGSVHEEPLERVVTRVDVDRVRRPPPFPCFVFVLYIKN